MSASAFPFLVGCERSGTTLLRAMLDSHPQVAVPHESYFVTDLARRRSRYEQNDRLDVALFTRDLSEHFWFARWPVGSAEIRRDLESEPPGNLAEGIRRVFAIYARSEGKPRYADKTPSYVLEIPLLAEVFPEARFVHLIRDGRDVALSLQEVRFGPGSLGEAALHWRRRVQRGREAGRTLGPERYLEVRYEELTDEPQRVLDGLCTFLGLPYDEAMLSYSDRPDLMRDFRREHQHNNLRKAPTAGLRDWRHEMSSRDVAVFEALAGEALLDLSYERAADPVPSWARLEAPGLRLASEVRRVIRRRRRSLGRWRGRRRLRRENAKEAV
jgi:hypothetical protein